MSCLPSQSWITPNNPLFLLANISSLTASDIKANTIETNLLSTGNATISSITGTEGGVNIDFAFISSLNSDGKIEANEFSSIFTFALEGTVSTLFTQHIVLDQAKLDVINGNTLLLNGVPLATTSTSISSLQDWSFFPAIYNVDMNGFALSNCGNIYSQNIYNALNVQSDTLSALTALTSPSATITNGRFTNLSTTNLQVNTITNSSNITFNQSLRAPAVSTINLSTATVNGFPFISGSNWSQYPATQTVNLQGNGLSNNGNLTITTTSNTTINTGEFFMTADGGLSIASITNVDITAQNGNRGQINLVANSGFNNGVAGQIFLTANGGQVAGVGTGGTIELTANTPIGFSNLTSKISLNASGINSYAGSIPALASAYGYNFIYGQNGVYIASGLPPGLPNVPGTTYIYGTLGIEMPSDAYMKNIYPYFDGITTPPDLNITGRYIIPNLAQVCVRMSNVKQIDFQENVATYMSNLDTLSMSSNGSITTSNLVATTAGITTLTGTTAFTTLNGTTLTATTVNGSNINSSNLVASNSLITSLVSTLAENVSSINGFTSFGQKSIRVQGDVAQIQLSNNNTGGAGTILNLLSRVATSEIQSFNSNFTTPLPLFLNASYTSTPALFCSTINGQSLPYPYGSFTVNANQTIGVPNTAVSTIFDTTEYANGISIVGGTSPRVAVSTTGLYRWLASPQFNTTSGGANPVSFWFQKNGVNIPRSASRATVANNATLFSAVEIYEQMNAQDTLSFCFTSSDTNMNLSYLPASGVVPVAPALILNGNKISE